VVVAGLGWVQWRGIQRSLISLVHRWLMYVKETFPDPWTVAAREVLEEESGG